MSPIDVGRNSIDVAQKEMLRLMMVRKKYGKDKTLKGAYIAQCLDMNVQTAVLIKTFTNLELRCIGHHATPP